jgi:hypothetical protein
VLRRGRANAPRASRPTFRAQPPASSASAPPAGPHPRPPRPIRGDPFPDEPRGRPPRAPSPSKTLPNELDAPNATPRTETRGAKRPTRRATRRARGRCAGVNGGGREQNVFGLSGGEPVSQRGQALERAISSGIQVANVTCKNVGRLEDARARSTSLCRSSRLIALLTPRRTLPPFSSPGRSSSRRRRPHTPPTPRARTSRESSTRRRPRRRSRARRRSLLQSRRANRRTRARRDRPKVWSASNHPRVPSPRGAPQPSTRASPRRRR